MVVIAIVAVILYFLEGVSMVASVQGLLSGNPNAGSAGSRNAGTSYPPGTNTTTSTPAQDAALGYDPSQVHIGGTQTVNVGGNTITVVVPSSGH